MPSSTSGWPKHLAEAFAGLPAAAQAQSAQAASAVNDISAIRDLPDGPIRDAVLNAFTNAMDDVFLVAVPFMAVALVVALFMREKPLAGRGETPGQVGQDEPALVTAAH